MFLIMTLRVFCFHVFLLILIVLDPQSFSGQKLLKRGDFHVGSHIKSILMLPKEAFPQNVNDKEETRASKNQDSLCLCASQDGSMGVLISLPEKTYRRLYFIQGQLINTEDKVAGLNPISYRYFCCIYLETLFIVILEPLPMLVKHQILLVEY